MRFIAALGIALAAAAALPAMAADLDCRLGVTAGAVYGRSSTWLPTAVPTRIPSTSTGVPAACNSAASRRAIA